MDGQTSQLTVLQGSTASQCPRRRTRSSGTQRRTPPHRPRWSRRCSRCTCRMHGRRSSRRCKHGARWPGGPPLQVQACKLGGRPVAASCRAASPAADAIHALQPKSSLLFVCGQFQPDGAIDKKASERAAKLRRKTMKKRKVGGVLCVLWVWCVCVCVCVCVFPLCACFFSRFTSHPRLPVWPRRVSRSVINLSVHGVAWL